MVSNSSTSVCRHLVERTYVVLCPDRYLQAMPAIFVLESVNIVIITINIFVKEIRADKISI